MSHSDLSKRILLTGSNGKLGQLLQSAWKQHGADGNCITSQSRGSDSDIQWSSGAPLKVFPQCHSIFALWGRTSGSETELQENTQLAHDSRVIAQHCGAQRVIHLSSAAVYGPGCNLTENAPLRPVNAYGRAKRNMEDQITQFRDEDSCAHICLRLANVVGADSLAPALQGDKPLHLDRFKDGRSPRRSYIAPGDLAALLVALCALPVSALPDTLNVAAPTPVAMADLAQAAKINIDWRDAPPTALAEVSLSTNRLATLLPTQTFHVFAGDMISDWHRYST